MSRNLLGLGFIALGYYLWKQANEKTETVVDKMVEDAKIAIAGVYKDPWDNYEVFSSFKQKFDDSEASTVAPSINATKKGIF